MTRPILLATAAALVLTMAACNKRNEKITNNPELNVAISDEVLNSEATADDEAANNSGTADTDYLNTGAAATNAAADTANAAVPATGNSTTGQQ